MQQAVLLAELASEQWGLVTAAQAVERGVTHQALAQLLREGAVERVLQGVYRMTGAPPGQFDDLRAAWLVTDPRHTAADRLRAPDAVVSFRSAARLYGLGDLDADRHEFTVAGRRQSRRPDVRFHRGELVVGDWRLVDGLPVTTIVKTIGDLASARTDGGHLAGVVRDAITIMGIDADEIATALSPHAHRYSVRLGDGEGLIARFLAEAGIPKATRQAVELAPPPQLSSADAARLEMLAKHPDLMQRMIVISRDAVDTFVRSEEFRAALTSLARANLDHAITTDLLDSIRTSAARALLPDHVVETLVDDVFGSREVVGSAERSSVGSGA